MQSRDRFTERYQDVLQNLEFGVTRVAKENPDLLDAHVELAYEALISYYRAETRGREPRTPDLDAPIDQVFESVRAMADFRLGRNPLPVTEDGGEELERRLPPLTLDEIIQCLKRLRKSVRFWSKRGGRRGYLTYISQFLPE